MLKRKLGYIDISIMCLVDFDGTVIRPISREMLNDIYQSDFEDVEVENWVTPEKPKNEFYEMYGVCPECFEQVEGVETETGTKFDCHYCDYKWVKLFD